MYAFLIIEIYYRLIDGCLTPLQALPNCFMGLVFIGGNQNAQKVPPTFSRETDNSSQLRLDDI